MSTPIIPPPGEGIDLGSDSGYQYRAIGTQVYRTDGVYCWPETSARAWPASAVARRIARRAAEAEKQRQRERAIIEAERRRMEHGRRVR